MIIDMHTHIINEKVYDEYRAKSKDKISRIITLQSWEENQKELLDFIETKDDVFLVAYVDIEGNVKRQLKEIDALFRQNKIVGIKLYPGYKHFNANDKRIHDVAELCMKYDKPLIFHLGDVNDPEGESVLKYAHPIYVDEMAMKYPDCKIIIAHFGFPYLMETALILNKNKNVYADLSGTIDNCNSQKEVKRLRKQYERDLKRVLTYYPQIKNKIMFGTDFAGEDTVLSQIEPYVKLVKNIFVGKCREDVFYKTADKLFFSF